MASDVQFWIEEAKRTVANPNGPAVAVSAFADIAIAMALDQIGDLLAEHNVQLTELVRLAREGREAWDASVAEPPRPCNAMGGGSAGLDTADDFAMHCAYNDGHDGPHSYEENTNGS